MRTHAPQQLIFVQIRIISPLHFPKPVNARLPQAEPLVARLLTARRALLYIGTTLPEQCSFDHSIPAGLKLAWGSFW